MWAIFGGGFPGSPQPHESVRVIKAYKFIFKIGPKSMDSQIQTLPQIFSAFKV